MPRKLRGSLGFLLLAALSDAHLAMAATTSLPAFRVDPTLLGLPSVAPPVAVPSAPVVEIPAANAVSAAAPSAPSVAQPGSAIAAPMIEKLAPGSAPTSPPQSLPVAAVSSASALAPGKQPVYLVADRIGGKTNVETVAEGNVDLRSGDRLVKADRLVYREPTDETEATGNVKLTSPGEAISGPHLKLKMDDSVGTFDTPTYSLHRQNGNDPAATAHGTAEHLDFQGKDKYHLANATYTTCPATGSDPDWFARMSSLDMDYGAGKGDARNATVIFKGVPILYSPYLSFTLDNQRKSGLLSPTIGSSSKGGPEFTMPYYWNIAPNMDATIAPRFMSKRGTQWTGEYRYLGQNYSGPA